MGLSVGYRLEDRFVVFQQEAEGVLARQLVDAVVVVDRASLYPDLL